jgi:hypothetical protein
VGRQDQIKQLRGLISDPDGSRELAITGLGGVGKTQEALNVAYQIGDDAPECSIFWIPCTSLDGVEQAYAEIAQQLELPGKFDAKKEVQTYLNQSTCERWLLIFDNADKEDTWIKNDSALQVFVPENEHGRTLFTSRNQQLALDLTDSNVIPLPEYDLNTGLEFLQRSLIQRNLIYDHDTTVQLLEELKLLPLAITQAVAYINKNQINLTTYIGLLKKQESDFIEILREDFQDKWRYKDIQNPVATTWWISFQQIQQSNPLAAEYLTFMACINPRNISWCMLPLANSENDKMKAIGLLRSYSLISNSEPTQDKRLSIHRLVHVARRNWMRTQKTLEAQTLRTIIQLGTAFWVLGMDFLRQPRTLRTSFTSPISCEGALMRQYMPHILTLLKGEHVRKQIKYTKLITVVSTCLMADMRLKEAEDLCTQFIQNADKEDGHDVDVLEIMQQLTTIHILQEKRHENKKIC